MKWLAGALGVVLLGGLALDARSALVAYLAAFACVASVEVGALTLAMIGRLTEARWYGEAARGAAEGIVSAIPFLPILFLPIALGLSRVYPWAQAAPGENALGLTPRVFLARSAVYLLSWAVLALLLPRAPRRTSAFGLVVVGFTVVFAAFDWLMSLEPGWYSSVFGVYFWSGGFLAALAVSVFLGRTHEALAKLILTASIFWAYIAYSQAVVVWIAQEPRETVWYSLRLQGPFGLLAAALVAAQFAVPVLVLLPHSWKRRPRVQLAASACVLAGHAFDMDWLVLPEVRPGILTHVLYVAALVVLSALVVFAASRQRKLVTA